jgi:hypothetical protein
MKLPLLAVVALAVLVGGCQTIRVGPEATVRLAGETITVVGSEGFDPGAVTAPNPNAPNVFIVNGQIVVDQEPLRPGAGQGSVRIVWALARNGGYSFPNDRAIELLPGPDSPLPQGLACGVVGAQKKEFVCKYRHARGQWKYKMAVVRDDGGPSPVPLDPWIIQN